MISSNNNFADINRILILGHTGFIGSRLVMFFQKQTPEIEIIGRSLPMLDLTDQKEVMSLTDLFDLKTAVIMCSAIKKQLGDSLDKFWQNLKMIVNLCHLLEVRPVRRFIYFSSAEVYGEDTHNTNIKENTPVNTKSYYGIAKYACERLLRKVISGGESSLLVLRPPLVYGPGDMSKSYGPSGFVWAAVNRKEITLWGDGSEQREFIFVDDLIKIVYRLAFHKYDGVINVASGKGHTFKEILGIVSGLVPFELKINSRPRTKQKVDNGFCNELLMQLLPDISFTSLEEGVKRTFDAEYQAIIEGEHVGEGKNL